MEMLSSFRGDKHEFCLVVIKFKHINSKKTLEKNSWSVEVGFIDLIDGVMYTAFEFI